MLRRVPTSPAPGSRASVTACATRRALSFIVVMGVAQPYPIGQHASDEGRPSRPLGARARDAARILRDAISVARPFGHFRLDAGRLDAGVVPGWIGGSFGRAERGGPAAAGAGGGRHRPG